MTSTEFPSSEPGGTRRVRSLAAIAASAVLGVLAGRLWLTAFAAESPVHRAGVPQPVPRVRPASPTPAPTDTRREPASTHSARTVPEPAPEAAGPAAQKPGSWETSYAGPGPMSAGAIFEGTGAGLLPTIEFYSIPVRNPRYLPDAHKTGKSYREARQMLEVRDRLGPAPWESHRFGYAAFADRPEAVAGHDFSAPASPAASARWYLRRAGAPTEGERAAAIERLLTDHQARRRKELADVLSRAMQLAAAETGATSADLVYFADGEVNVVSAEDSPDARELPALFDALPMLRWNMADAVFR